MMMRFYKHTVLLLSFLIFCSFSSHGQIAPEETGPSPEGGLSKLALVYFQINFTKEQRETLNNLRLELIFSVDTLGKATLEKVHGVQDQVILDSLLSVNHKLPRFSPKKVGGQVEDGLFVMHLEFPDNRKPVLVHPYQRVQSFTQAKAEDFEYIEPTGQSVYILAGGNVNNFLGKTSDHLGLGGGFNIGLMYKGKFGVGAGFLMNFYGNKLKEPFHVAPGREHNSAPPTLMVGVGFNRLFLVKPRTEFNVQLDLLYVIQNIVPATEQGGDDYVQFKGFSPGLVANYLVQLGKDKISAYYQTPSLQHHFLNFHLGLRPLFMNHSAARGLMIETGLSYRLGYDFVADFKLKE